MQLPRIEDLRRIFRQQMERSDENNTESEVTMPSHAWDTKNGDADEGLHPYGTNFRIR
jgi:hypothetical protein